MKSGLWSYIKAAFNCAADRDVRAAQLGRARVALPCSGSCNPGFWAIGAGLELAYLFGLSTNWRFQRVVDGRHCSDERNSGSRSCRS